MSAPPMPARPMRVSRVTTAVGTVTAYPGDRPKAWTFLASLPIVNLKAVWLIVLDTFTMVLAIILCFVPSTPVAARIFEGWLFFAGALHGVNGGQYIAKRFTSTDGNADEQPVPGMRAQDREVVTDFEPDPDPAPPAPRPAGAVGTPPAGQCQRPAFVGGDPPRDG